MVSTGARFNYIITIHNKEELIYDVVISALLCCGSNSHIYCVLDGCTDRTECIIDEILKKYTEVPLTKLYMPDVHELLSINAALKQSPQDMYGYNIILQDDVILADINWEQKVLKLYEWAGKYLGIISFRLGVNLKRDWGVSDEVPPFQDYVENAYGHGLPNTEVLLPGQFTYRAVPIKSPICIPCKIVGEVGLCNEQLAPWDDTEYAVRALKAGYKNGVFALKFYSKVEWGHTRKAGDQKTSATLSKNLALTRTWYKDCWDKEFFHVSDNKIYDVPGLVSKITTAEAMEYRKKAVLCLKKYKRKRAFSVAGLCNLSKVVVNKIRKKFFGKITKHE